MFGNLEGSDIVKAFKKILQAAQDDEAGLDPDEVDANAAILDEDNTLSAQMVVKVVGLFKKLLHSLPKPDISQSAAEDYAWLTPTRHAFKMYGKTTRLATLT